MSEVYIVTALIKITLDIRKASAQASRNKRRMTGLCERAEWFIEGIEQVRKKRDFKPSELARLQRLQAILEEILEFVQNSNSKGWLRRLWQATSDKDAIELFHDDINRLREDMNFFLTVDDDGIRRRPFPPMEGRLDWEDFQQILDELSRDNDEAIAEELQLANIPKDRFKATIKRKLNESKTRSIEPSSGVPSINSLARMLKPEQFRPNLRTLSKEKHPDFVIGDGAFGTVFKTIWETRGFEVAVKVLKCKHFSKTAEESLRHEVEIMTNLGHNDHVIDVFGFYADPAGNFALVMSFAPGGSLRDRLDRADFATVPWSQKWDWVEGVAKGMAWLHSAEPQIIHRDLKSDNVLLGQRGEARISDFGCAIIAKTETTISSGGDASVSTAGSHPWFPPEAFIDGTQLAAGDVYAFAIVMWEIATGQLPWPGTGPSLIPGLVKEGQRPNVRNIVGDDEYVSLMTRCWQQSPAARPPFGLITDELSCRHYNSAYSLKSKTSSTTSKQSPEDGATSDSSATTQQQDNMHETTTSIPGGSNEDPPQAKSDTQGSSGTAETETEKKTDSSEPADEPPKLIGPISSSNTGSTVSILSPTPATTVVKQAPNDASTTTESNTNLSNDLENIPETSNENDEGINQDDHQQPQEKDEGQEHLSNPTEVLPIPSKPSSVNVAIKQEASSLPFTVRIQRIFEDLKAKWYAKDDGPSSLGQSRAVGLSRTSEGQTNQSPDTTETDPEQPTNYSSFDSTLKRASHSSPQQPQRLSWPTCISKQMQEGGCRWIRLSYKQRICLGVSVVLIIILAIVLGVTLNSNSSTSGSGGSPPGPPSGSPSVPPSGPGDGGDDKNDTTTGSPELTSQLLIGDGSVRPSNFGFTVALSGDGKTAVSGGTEDNDGLGATWMFVAPNNFSGKWSQQGPKLSSALLSGATLAPSTTFFPNEGMDVALNTDGSKAIVGMQNGNTGLGVVYRRIGQTWAKEASLVVPNVFAYEVAMNAAGTTALVGGFSFLKQGRPRAFTFSLEWSTGTVLNGTNAIPDKDEMYFAVALSADGNTAFIGEPNDNSKKGAMWAFQLQDNNTWVQQGSKLVGTGAVGASQQGRTVALSADGNLAVSCGVADDSFQGALWTFQRTGSTWTQLGSKFTISNKFNMGNGLALNAAGDIALVTIEQASNIDALLLSRSGSTWRFRQLPVQTRLSSFDRLSVGLSSSGTTAMIGDWQNETALVIENLNTTEIFA